MLAEDKQRCLAMRNDTQWEEEQRTTPRRTWPPPLALRAPSLHFSESKWTAKGREQPKIASLEFSSMPLLLPVIASRRRNRSPSSYFKLVKECVLQRWRQSHLTHESSSGNRVKLDVGSVNVGAESCTWLTWRSWWRSAESVCRAWIMQASVSVVYYRTSGGGKWAAGWIDSILSANVGRLNSTVLLEGPLPSPLSFLRSTGGGELLLCSSSIV